MPLPQHPAPDRPHSWLRGLRIAPPRQWRIAGAPGYLVDAEGRLWREAYTDAAGHRRQAKEVRKRIVAGTSHFRLFVNGWPVWVSQRKLRARLRRVY